MAPAEGRHTLHGVPAVPFPFLMFVGGEAAPVESECSHEKKA